jgi:hypothetical protein
MDAHYHTIQGLGGMGSGRQTKKDRITGAAGEAVVVIRSRAGSARRIPGND